MQPSGAQDLDCAGGHPPGTSKEIDDMTVTQPDITEIERESPSEAGPSSSFGTRSTKSWSARRSSSTA